MRISTRGWSVGVVLKPRPISKRSYRTATLVVRAVFQTIPRMRSNKRRHLNHGRTTLIVVATNLLLPL